MLKYKHLLWDFDGTLFDTYPALVEAMTLSLREMGYSEKREDVYALLKQSMGKTERHYMEKYGLTAEQAAHYRGKEMADRTGFWDSPPMPHIPQVLQALQEAGAEHYLYTHRDRVAVEFLKKHDLLKYFRECVTSEYGFPSKPAPDAVKYLMEKYSMAQEETLMLGDREIDILACKNAGGEGCFFDAGGLSCQSAKYNIVSFTELLPVVLGETT